MRNLVSRFIRTSFQGWLNKRIPPSASITLSMRRIFILPTKQGVLFGGLLLLMLIGSINYQNSLGFILTFLLGSLFAVSMLHTYRNLSGVTIAALHGRNAFLGEDAEFCLLLSRQGKRTHEALRLKWTQSSAQVVSLQREREEKVRLYVKAQYRGKMRPGRLLVETTYPLGLVRAWSWLDLNLECLVYPQPKAAGSFPQSSEGRDDGEMASKDGVDDFVGLRDYHRGDPLKHVAWKNFAKGRGLYIKQFASYIDRKIWLDWEQLPASDRELKLSKLCDWVLRLSCSEDEYGLKLPGIQIEPSRGIDHREKCLRALALFEWDRRRNQRTAQASS